MPTPPQSGTAMVNDIVIEDIGYIDRVVDLDHPDAVGAGTFERRFPGIHNQSSGVVFDPQTQRILYLRWVASRHKQFGNEWDAQGQTLGFAIHAHTESQLRAKRSVHTGSTFNVLLLFGNKKYDVGTFMLREISTNQITIFRVVKGNELGYMRVSGDPIPSSASGSPSQEEQECGQPQPQPQQQSMQINPDPAGSGLEVRYRTLFAFWGIEVLYNSPNLPYGDMRTYKPDGIFNGGLSAAVRSWCGAHENWHTCVLLEIKPVFPSQDVFSKVKATVILHRWPLLIVYGSPAIAPSTEQMDYNLGLGGGGGMMGILVRPGDGATARVHFNLDQGQVELQLGEPGEHGPIHPSVLAGHAVVGLIGTNNRPTSAVIGSVATEVANRHNLAPVEVEERLRTTIAAVM